MFKNGIITLQNPYDTDNQNKTHQRNIEKIYDSSKRVSSSLRIIMIGQLENCYPDLLCSYYCELVSSNLGSYGDFFITLPWSKNVIDIIEKIMKIENNKNFTFLKYENDNEEIKGINNIKGLDVKELKTEKLSLDIGKLEVKSEKVKTYSSVAVGGTFDRIHSGHKILLTTVVLSSNLKNVIIGISGDEFLKERSKSNKELIYPYQKRRNSVKLMVDLLNPIIKNVEYVKLDDPFGPTITRKEVDSIVVSKETIRGAEKINSIRKEKGMAPLEMVIIPCISPRNSK